MAFDLDPGEPAGIMECCEVAVLLRELLDQLGLECFPKTSGSKGMQVYAPLDGEATYDETKPLSQALARHLEAKHPKLVVSTQKKELRKGKVLVDWSQNDEHKTTVCVYSLRARERPTVSTPADLGRGRGGLASPPDLVFEAADVLERCEEHGDLFAPGGRAGAGAARAVACRCTAWSTGRSPARSRASRRARRRLRPPPATCARRWPTALREVGGYTGLDARRAGAAAPELIDRAELGRDQPRLARAAARAGGRAAGRAPRRRRAARRARCAWAPAPRWRPRRAW